MKTRTDIINVLFEKYSFKSYLEIGVRVAADNFDKIKTKFKHSIDPNPKGNYTHNMTSDEFFENHVKDQKYDVIFIDWMHTEEQAYKDVKNSIKCLNKDGFIVIHDCNPENEFLTRSYEEYLNNLGGWNGTVYRAFIKLKYELRDWSCFVVNENYGCGILTSRKILENKLINFNIDDFTWNDFEKNRKELLQLLTYEEYTQLLNL